MLYDKPITDDTIVLAAPDRLGIWNYFDSIEEANACTVRCQGYEAMTIGQFKTEQKATLMDQPIREESVDSFDEALGSMPPKAWKTLDGGCRFFMAEHYTGAFTREYACINNRCWSKLVDVTDPATWIENNPEWTASKDAAK